MAGLLSLLFGGNKSEKDVKKISPLVEKINAFFEEYKSLSNDELRGKTIEFRARIKEYLKDTDNQIESQKAEAEKLDSADISGRDAIYRHIDDMTKDRDKKLEEVLFEILPEAFAVVKETSRRFKENTELVATATELDKTLAQTKKYLRIEGDKSIYQNTWTAGGNEIVWNMVPYDVQLIGGIVLHQGKIAEMATGEGKH
jgi:preprotein translocase subunit SecA